MNLMQILTLSYEFPPLGGGGAKVVDGLARQLVELGHGVDLVTMGFRELPKFEVLDGIQVTRLASVRRRTEICYPHEMLWHMLRALPQAKRLVATRRYDINHAHFIYPDGVLAWNLKLQTGLPYVITAHGSDVPGYNPDRFRLLHTLLAPLWKRVVENAECVICPSAHLQRLIEKRGHSVTSEVIPNGMYENKFVAGRDKRMRILVVTRMFERKGVQYLLTALRGRTLDCEINIVGDGPYLEKLKQIARDTQANVRFLGWLDNNSDELKELYETSTIFVFTSLQENFPINLLEAMAAGLAIITSEDPGSREVVGDAALQVPVDEPDRLFAILLELTKNPARCADLGMRARQRLDTHFKWPTVAGRYQALFQKLVG
jgi:glycosyltransferase involved in cell wall biosynthesis